MSGPHEAKVRDLFTFTYLHHILKAGEEKWCAVIATFIFNMLLLVYI